jgi:hypothetical protein
MTTSERFLARRGQAWLLIGAAWPFARPRTTSWSRLKVPTRYTPSRIAARPRRERCCPSVRMRRPRPTARPIRAEIARPPPPASRSTKTAVTPWKMPADRRGRVCAQHGAVAAVHRAVLQRRRDAPKRSSCISVPQTTWHRVLKSPPEPRPTAAGGGHVRVSRSALALVNGSASSTPLTAKTFWMPSGPGISESVQPSLRAAA